MHTRLPKHFLYSASCSCFSEPGNITSYKYFKGGNRVKEGSQGGLEAWYGICVPGKIIPAFSTIYMRHIFGEQEKK